MSGFKLLFLALWDELKTLISWKALFSRNKYRRSQKADSNAYNKKDCAKRKVGSPIQIPRSISHQKSSDGHRDKPNWVEVGQFILAVLTFITALGLACIYYKQMEANKTQATAAVNQFAVMTNQLNEMQFAREMDERAWVNVFRMTVATNVSPIIFEAHFKNTGKTPSKKTSAGMGATLDTNVVLSAKYITNSSSQILPPGVESEVLCDLLLSEAERQDVMNGKKLIYVYGRISYEDVFTTEHWSRFCYIMDPVTSRSYPAQFGNDCDDAGSNKRK
jgi:hypothetical protein